MGQKIMRDLRMEIFRHLQKLDVSFFDKNPVGRLMTRVTTDVDALNELFTSGVISVFEDIFTLSGIIISLFLLNYKLALAIVAILPLLILVTLMFKIKVRDSYRRVRTAIARINAFLQENITGAAVVQIFGQERKQYRKFTHINKEHLDANLQSIFYYAIFYPLLELISAMAIALIIWYGGHQVLSGALTLGTLVAFIQYSDRFFRPISDLSEKYTILQAAMASSERIFKLLDTRTVHRVAANSTGACGAERQHRIPERQFFLQSRRTGAPRYFLQSGAGRKDRRRRRHRRRQIDDHLAAEPFLRRAAGRNPDRWRKHKEFRSAGIAQIHRHCASGCVSVFGKRGRKHPAGKQRHLR